MLHFKVLFSFIEKLLEKVVIEEDEKGKESIFIPGQVLLDIISEKQEIPITFELGEDKSSIVYRYTGKENILETPLDFLIRYAKSTDSIEDFLIKDEKIGRAHV